MAREKSDSGMAILLDDDAMMRDIVQYLLEKLGYTVMVAARPAEAIAFAEANREQVCLLLTDVVMPEMNGKEAACHVQAVCPDIRVLFMSGYPVEVVTGRNLLDANASFIHKPFTLEKLGETIRTIIAS